ncbi:c-type cytochrome [Helicobacter japonicus]|uniref:c-type cytochrome n=3 Tax=Helicobacter japonicus TaxID=425400 RepID=UPI0005143D1E
MYKFLLVCVVALFCACSNEKNKEGNEAPVFQSNQAPLPIKQPSLEDNIQTETSIPQDSQIQDTQSVEPKSNVDEKKQEVATSDAATLYARCAACHGKDGKSVAPGSVGNVLIASMNKAQVIESLKGFRARTLSRGGNSVIMYMQTKNLSDKDIEALATYIDSF